MHGPGTNMCRLMLAAVAAMAAGCRSNIATGSADVVFVLHGIEGDGPWYNGLMQGLARGPTAPNVMMVRWGVPTPLFLLNLRSRAVHEKAERNLAQRIEQWRALHPEGRVSLVGHSGGCGVILGALEELDGDEMVNTVVLLAPAVSPDYDLSEALERVAGRMHVFRSDRDDLLLGWGAQTFGLYDEGGGRRAAGHGGFADIERLPEELRSRLVDHAYDPAWKTLGHDGGHFGARSTRFVEQVLAPLL